MSKLPITSFTSLQIQSPVTDGGKPTDTTLGQGSFAVSQMTTDQKKALGQVQNGTIVYDITLKQFAFYQNNAWVAFPAPAGNVTPLNSGITIDNSNPGFSEISLSFATINPTINGDIVDFSNVLNIGPTTPYMLDSSYGFVSSEGAGINQAGTIAEVSLTMTGAIVTSQLHSLSSKNIKTILSDKKVDIVEEVYNLFKSIKLVKYEYKDKLKYGSGIYYGVIAEEVKCDFQHFVHDMQEATPNIMKKGNVEYINSKTIRVNFETENYWENSITKGDRIVIFSEHNTQIKDLIIDKIPSTGELILSSTIDLRKDLNEVFVYGTEKNCPAVAKERLFEMGLVVIQSLMDTVENLTNRINILEQKEI